MGRSKKNVMVPSAPEEIPTSSGSSVLQVVSEPVQGPGIPLTHVENTDAEIEEEIEMEPPPAPPDLNRSEEIKRLGKVEGQIESVRLQFRDMDLRLNQLDQKVDGGFQEIMLQLQKLSNALDQRDALYNPPLTTFIPTPTTTLDSAKFSIPPLLGIIPNTMTASTHMLPPLLSTPQGLNSISAPLYSHTRSIPFTAY